MFSRSSSFLFIRASWFIAQEIGVSTIPVSEVSGYHKVGVLVDSTATLQFYCDEHRNIGEAYIRFAFCKDEDTLRLAGERLNSLTKYLA
jgi:kynurenine aminotransferase